MARSPVKVVSDVTPRTEETLDFNEDILRAIAEVYKNEGNDEYRKNDFSKAINFYTEGINVNSKDKELNAKLYINRAISHFHLGNYHDSLTDARTATELHPNYLKAIIRVIAEVFRSVGNDKYREKDFSKAIHFYTEGIKLNCKDEELKAILYSNRAIAQINLGNYHDSLNDARTATELKPNYVKAIMRGAIACVELNQFEEAVSWCDKGLAIDKKNRDLLELRKKAAGKQKKLEESSRCNNDFERAKCCCLGIAFFKLGNFKKALHYHDLHLTMAKEVGNKTEEGVACCNLGLAFYGLSDFKKAEEYHRRDLVIAKEIGSKAAEARAYGNLGNALYGFGHFRIGIEYHNLRLAVIKEVGNKAWEGDVYGDLGIGFFNLGNFEKVMQFYNRQLSISREAGDKEMEKRAYGNLGNAYYHLGDLKKSIEYYNLALSVSTGLGNRYMEGQLHGNLGCAFHKLGDFKKAIRYLLTGVSAAEESGNKMLKGLFCRNLGNAFFSLGDCKKAEEYLKEDLATCKEVGDRAGEARAYNNLANVLSSLGDFKKALEYLQLALTIANEVGDKTAESVAHDNLGTFYQRLHMFKKAIEHHKLALGLAKEVGEKAAEGRATGNLGRAFEGLAELDKAISYFRVSLSIAEEVGDKVMEGHAHQVLGNSLESLGHLSEARECYQSSVRLYNVVRSLLRSKDEWKINFRHKNHSAYNALWRILLKEDKAVEALFAAEEGRAQALTDLMECQYGVPASQVEIRRRNTIDFKMLQCIPSTTSFQALDKDTITSWVIVKGKPEVVERKVFAHDATAFFRVLIRITYNNIGVGDDVSCEDRSMDALREEPLLHVKTSLHASTPQESTLNTLYNIIIKPISNLIQGSELIIVPDGPLWLAPYAAFKNFDSKYLCESFRIRLIPSLTSLKMIADCPEEYHCKSGALLVGDPWVAEVTDSKGQKLLEQLKFAKMEVEMIGKILNVAPLIGKKATKAEVLRRMSSIALVHIAAHGCEKTGEIVLTPDPNRATRIPKEEDYFLTVADVLSAQLRARLVVLSCCHSGRGEIKAEGVVGIARAFMAAGARSVLVSLWAIDDEATLEFMRSFYRHLVKGRSASESLNLAMKTLRKSDKYSDVKYWAPFVLIGDDVTLEFGVKK